MVFAGVSYLAILVAAVASWFFGAAWYTLLAKPWMAARGYATREEMLGPSGKPSPVLATAWDAAPDGKTFTLKLREGVNWHDGKPFTSADVACSILTLKQVHPRGRSTFANVTDVKTPDPYTAVIELSRPAPFLLTALAGTGPAGPVTAHEMSAPGSTSVTDHDGLRE